MKRTMRQLSSLLLLLVIFAGIDSSEAAGIEFPNKVINLVVPFPPGGGTDVVGRMIAEVMGEFLPTKVIVVNKGGAAGVVGTQQVALAKPDGYTLLFTSQSIVTQSYETKGRVSHKQFILLGMLNEDAFGIAVARDAPWQTLQEFIKDAKTRPGKI
ncbi:MAG: tripartite tricarboxylate transporter substrate-binding protein, partial [Sulfuricaulis sp.]|nr:tripartite tricarboxylate transporter substrate-binding protein [Sulfuricaulis sp.]